MNNQNISNKNGADKKNAAKAVRIVINAMPTGKEFHGWELKNECVKLYPELKNMYIETFCEKCAGIVKAVTVLNPAQKVFT